MSVYDDFSPQEKAVLKLAADRASKVVRKREQDSDKDIIGKVFTSMRQQDCVRHLKIVFPRLKELSRCYRNKRDKFLYELIERVAKRVNYTTQKEVDTLRGIVYSSRILVKEADRIIRRSDDVIGRLITILEREENV